MTRPYGPAHPAVQSAQNPRHAPMETDAVQTVTVTMEVDGVTKERTTAAHPKVLEKLKAQGWTVPAAATQLAKKRQDAKAAAFEAANSKAAPAAKKEG